MDAGGADAPPAPPCAGEGAESNTAVATAMGMAAADAIVLPEEPVDDRINDFTSAFCADTLSAIIFSVSAIMTDWASTPRSAMYCSNACFNVSRARDSGVDILIRRNENLFKKLYSFQFYSIKL
jgi:hypothetical protein